MIAADSVAGRGYLLDPGASQSSSAKQGETQPEPVRAEDQKGGKAEVGEEGHPEQPFF